MKKNSLLVLVACVHFGYAPLAAWLFPGAEVAAGKALFYIFRGVEGAILWGVVLWLLPKSLPVVVACGWGIAESAQTAACRLALPIAGHAPVAPDFGGMCDLVSGLPVVGITAVFVLAALSIVQEAACGKKG